MCNHAVHRLDLWFDDCAIKTKNGEIISKDTTGGGTKRSLIPSLQNDVKALVTSSDSRY